MLCSRYGGSVALKRFVDAANARGLGVMLDVVYNHFDAGNALNNWDGNDEYFYTDSRRNTPWGPRPNYDTQYVREQFLVGNINTLISEFHISGFRWDSTICIRQYSNPGRVRYLRPASYSNLPRVRGKLLGCRRTISRERLQAAATG